MKLKSFFVQQSLLFSAAVIVAFLLAYGIKMILPHPIFASYLLGGVFGVAFVIGVAKFYSQKLLNDVNIFTQAAAAMQQGEKGEPLRFPDGSDFEELADTMNGMIDRDKAVREANEDPLTGLANRRYLTQRLESLLEKERPLAVMFIDLDGFKPINDEYGHDVGDEALRMVSDRLSACVREQDVLSRIGGDEFVILFNGLEDEEVLKERGDKVLEMVRTPMWISGNRVRMGASIGISISPKDGTDSETIINAADESMYAAKQGGKNAYRFYS